MFKIYIYFFVSIFLPISEVWNDFTDIVRSSTEELTEFSNYISDTYVSGVAFVL